MFNSQGLFKRGEQLHLLPNCCPAWNESEPQEGMDSCHTPEMGISRHHTFGQNEMGCFKNAWNANESGPAKQTNTSLTPRHITSLGKAEVSHLQKVPYNEASVCF